jgi:CO/xanthine dehydrogenase Mo-binding subunit
MTMIGAAVLRVEDERFLRGEGKYIADLALPFMAEAFIFRSPHAHARIVKIDSERARKIPGVIAVLTSADLPVDLPPIPCRIPTHGDLSPFLQHVLANGTARYAGEPIAIIVAENRAIAEDAAEALEVDWLALPVVANADAALDPRSPSMHDGGNIASSWEFDIGDVDKAKAAAAVVVQETFTVQRHTAMPLETRGLLAQYDRARGLLEVFGPTKVPHTNRIVLAQMLRMPESGIRLAEPDVGGSFGARGEFYPEDFLIPWLALRLGRPIRWIEDRFEHFASINHSRESKFEVTCSADAEGRITAFDLKLISDLGAYARTHGDVVPSHASASFPGPYRIRNYRVKAYAALSNKTPSGTVRAPGMFEANFARERIIDMVAEKLGMDRAEIRRRNLIQPAEMPWHVGTESVRRPTIFDSGDFPALFDQAIATFGWKSPIETTSGVIRRGRGIAALVEPSALGPFEGARVEVDRLGFVNVISGSSAQGQGHETILAQVCTSVLGVPLDKIKVRHGDTALIQFGGGSYASRTAVMAGNAVYSAASVVREKALKIAAMKLQAAEADLDFTDGRVSVRGEPGRSITLAALSASLSPGNAELMPPPSENNIPDHEGLAATQYIRGVLAGTAVFALHFADVTVDCETGQVRVERYGVMADVGRAINPMIVEGQLVGGVVQGLGGTLFEELVYDSEGQLQTGSFADYLLPSAHEAPPIEAVIVENAKSPTNPLGVKGVGEVGPSGVAAAVGNAVAHALGQGTRVCALPLFPERILNAIANGARP